MLNVSATTLLSIVDLKPVPLFLGTTLFSPAPFLVHTNKGIKPDHSIFILLKE